MKKGHPALESRLTVIAVKMVSRNLHRDCNLSKTSLINNVGRREYVIIGDDVKTKFTKDKS
jgi:hypothetical protein